MSRNATSKREMCIRRMTRIFEISFTAAQSADSKELLLANYVSVAQLAQDFEAAHLKIIQDAESDFDAEDKIRASFDEMHYSIRAAYHALKAETAKAVADNGAPSTVSKIKLPRIALPQFSGDLAQWPAFIALYDASIHKNTQLTDVEKFQYLLAALKGEALNIIKHMPLAPEHYNIAYETLANRYRNKRKLATHYWHSIANAKSLKADSATGLRQLVDTFNENLRALQLMGFPVESWDFILLNTLLSKLTPSLREKFEAEHRKTEIPKFDHLTEFLEEYCRVLTSLMLSPSGKSSGSPAPADSKRANSVSTFVASDASCPCCGESHLIARCPTFTQMSEKDRHLKAKDLHLCLNCLRAGHRINSCPSKGVCRTCKGKHHSLLHFANLVAASATPAPAAAVASTAPALSMSTVPSEGHQPPVVSMTSTSRSGSVVLLSTIRAEMADAHGGYVPVRVLLDSASQSNFITEDCVQKGGVTRSQCRLTVQGIGATRASTARGRTSILLRARGREDSRMAIDAVVMPRISSPLPECEVEPRSWAHLKGLELADPEYHQPGRIDILLGADSFVSVLREGHRKGKTGEPDALNTLFGWVLMGAVPTPRAHSVHSFVTTLDSLEASVANFWSVEEVPSRQVISREDRRCEEQFKETTRREADGRFTVSYPFATNSPSFVDSRPIAVSRFRSLERRFRVNPALHAQYSAFMRDYLESGHMELVQHPAPPDGRMFYMPHHGVSKIDSETTKLRVVFDASSRCPNGLALNNTLLCGPKLQQDIVAILLRFRVGAVALTADVWLRDFGPSAETDSAPCSLIEAEEATAAFLSAETPNRWESLLAKFSSLKTICRVVAYCLRFIRRTQGKPVPESLAVDQLEAHAALLELVRMVQGASFEVDLAKLRSGGRVSRDLRKLAPYIDARGVLRVGGRIARAIIPHEAKHPALLPRQHRLTTLIIERVHRENLHPGRRALQYLVAQQFWIMGVQRAIGHVLSRCYRCFRAKPRAIQPYMADLPAARLQSAKPFAVTGVDYAGPFAVTPLRARGSRALKAYVCVFVCFTTKAVHLEVAFSLSTESFLAALRRFIARRGRCSHLYSDCGTNFVGAHRELNRHMALASEIESIRWSFNPPSAPHFGGIWEAGVKAFKTHLSRVVGDQTLSIEEFSTVLAQIEAVLNSRPLCPLSADPTDLTVLSPGHFLTTETLVSLPGPDLTDVPENRLGRWQLLQRMHQDFWRRWHVEYLQTLQQRAKWQKRGHVPTVNDLVLIREEHAPPLRWRLGRISVLHPGEDGVPRVATVRTTEGDLTRPLVKLCPLPAVDPPEADA